MIETCRKYDILCVHHVLQEDHVADEIILLWTNQITDIGHMIHVGRKQTKECDRMMKVLS